jgi:PHS family inorganic phosphate transporter-like MFS transporter
VADNPSVLSKLWASKDLVFMANGTTPTWFQNSIVQPSRIEVTYSNGTLSQLELGDIWPDNVESTPLIKAVLRENMTTAIYTVSISSILGLILLIFLINKLDRRRTLTVTFLILAGLLFVACGCFEALFHQEDRHILLIVLWVAISFFFSFGPNTLTFIVSELHFDRRWPQGDRIFVPSLVLTHYRYQRKSSRPNIVAHSTASPRPPGRSAR